MTGSVLTDEDILWINREAVVIARGNSPVRTGKGIASYKPCDPPKIGIIAIDYMVILDRGFKAFTMYALEGKVIPIRDASGKVHFRSAWGASAPGRRKITARNEKGQIVSSKVMWRHPGVEPMMFLRNAIRQAVHNWALNKTPGELKTSFQGTEAGRLILDILTGEEAKRSVS